MSAYYIRTRVGEKGPFSAEQLFRLVDEGRIPVTLQVIDAESGEWVVVESLYPPAGDELDDVLEDEVFEDEDAFESDVPAPVRPVSRVRASRGWRRRSRARGVRGFRRRRLSSRRESDYDQEDSRRPLRRGSTDVVPWVVGGVAGLVALVGAVLLWPKLFGDPLLGTWVLDTHRNQGLLRAFESAETADSALARQAYEDFLRRAELTIGERTISLRYDLPGLPNLANAAYRRRRYADGKYDLAITQRYDGPETLEAELRLGILYLRDRDGKPVAFTKK